MFAHFEHEHSKAWSAEIAKYDGYVRIISPQLPQALLTVDMELLSLAPEHGINQQC